MNTKILIVGLVSSLIILQSSQGQGLLTPPGAPAPMMKTLDQLEPRVPISSAPFTITAPGSYYLTANLNVTNGNAITIATNQVTLDLNGFTISSTAPTAVAGTYAIELAVTGGNSDVTIFNGHIASGATNNGSSFSGSGFGSGIDLPGTVLQNVHVRDVTVTGCLNFGIYVGTGQNTTVESCSVQNSNEGIIAQIVTHSAANQCGAYGIVAGTVSDSYGSVISTGVGINANTVNNCQGIAGGAGTGIYAIVSAIGCYGSAGGGGAGIHASIANSCFSSTGNGSITHAYNMP
jgi:hypothetical protein